MFLTSSVLGYVALDSREGVEVEVDGGASG